MATPSQRNAQQCRDFVSTLHTKPYTAIDPATVTLSSLFVVCIIGGRGAAGGGLARAYARAGASGIIVAARNREALDETAEEVRAMNPATKVVACSCDISSSQNVEALADTVRAEFDGRLDVVVVNSGFSGPMSKQSIIQESPQDFQTAFNVHAIGTFNAAHHLLPLLLETENGARSFVAISSISAPAVAGFASHSHYCTSKAAQARLIEMLYEQYAQKGVFCATVHPGGMKSDFSRSASMDIQHLLNDDPDLVGAFCVWLTKSEGSQSQREALNGRFLSCKWDVVELEAKFKDILDKDLLRFRIAVD